MICEITKNKKFRKNVAKKICVRWTIDQYFPSNGEIFQAKILVNSGHLQTGVIESLATRIRAKWVLVDHFPLAANITTAANLVYHGVLRSVEVMLSCGMWTWPLSWLSIYLHWPPV